MRAPCSAAAAWAPITVVAWLGFMSVSCASVADVEPDAFDQKPELLTYYRDVKPIIDNHCTPCHRPGGIGGRGPMTSYADVGPVRELIATSVAAGYMPPWPAKTAPFDFFQNERRLTPEERLTIVDWVKQGGVAGRPEQEPIRETLPIKRAISRVDGKLEMAEAYTPLGRPDEYRCFPFEWPYDTTKYLTAVGVEPGVRTIVQRAIAYVVPPESAQRVFDRDEAAPGPGYPCTGVSETGAWVGSYARGSYGVDLPTGIGFEVQPGSAVVLLVHYNTAELRVPVRSRIEYTVEDKVDRVGTMVLIDNPLWVAGYMPVPAGDGDVLHSVVLRPTGMVSDVPYDLYSVSLNMRALGRSGSVGIVRNGHQIALGTAPASPPIAGSAAPSASGETDNPSEVPSDQDDQSEGADSPAQPNTRHSETVLSIPRWSLSWQETYVLSQPTRVETGDSLYVECHFDNTQEHQPTIADKVQTARDVNWGDKATDELCMGAVLLAPAD